MPELAPTGPRIAVITPSLNAGRFIDDAILSVQGQDLRPTSHVVQDGGSTDETIQIMARHLQDVSFQSATDEGQSDALNKALRRVDADWIGWLNTDEFYLPQALSTLSQIALSNEADVAFGDAIFVDKDGRFLRLVPQHPLNRFVLKRYGPALSTCACLIRRSVLGIDPFDLRFRRLMDWDLFLHLAESGASFHYLAWPVGAFRVHEEQVTAAPQSDFSIEYELLEQKYGRAVLRRLGRYVHAGLKLAGGAYLRQLKTRRLRGTLMTWFDGHHQGTSELTNIYGGGEQLSR